MRSIKLAAQNKPQIVLIAVSFVLGLTHTVKDQPDFDIGEMLLGSGDRNSAWRIALYMRWIVDIHKKTRIVASLWDLCIYLFSFTSKRNMQTKQRKKERKKKPRDECWKRHVTA